MKIAQKQFAALALWSCVCLYNFYVHLSAVLQPNLIGDDWLMTQSPGHHKHDCANSAPKFAISVVRFAEECKFNLMLCIFGFRLKLSGSRECKYGDQP